MDSTPTLDSNPATPSSGSSPRTRTLAIIKNHALKHRLDIEPRIIEAGFEIVKERQLEFDVETDPEFMYELFGEDVSSLAEGPVWVYVLERRRSIEVLHALMGDRDPAVARETAPNSLRALYGISLAQNGMLGSPDAQTAEFQIATIFTSSPVFPTSELPDETGSTRKFDSVRSLSSDLMDSLRLAGSNGEEYAQSTATNQSSTGRESQGVDTRTSTSDGKPIFRARGLPKTHVAPDIAPRTTKAAALRAGQVAVTVDKVTPTAPRAPLSEEALAKTFANVPGHKRSSVIQVASTAAPVIAPRMTKAASLRIAKDAAAANGSAPKKRPSMGTVNPPEKKVVDPLKVAKTFENVPGHKRPGSIQVASTATPTVAPRMNKSAALRAKEVPPSSYQLRAPTSTDTASGSRTSSRPASAQSNYTEPKQERKRPVSLQPPAIAPRPNKSAELRAAKKENGTPTKRPVFL